MGAFDGSIKIQRAVKDPQTDHKLPSPKSLSWGEVTGVTGLAGTTGNHCELVHGDHWRQVDGNLQQNIDADLITNVAGDEARTITGNHMHTVTGDHTHSVIGNHTQSVTGNQNTSVIGDAIAMHVGTCTKTYVDSKVETYSKHLFQCNLANSFYTWTEGVWQGYGLKMQTCLYQVQMNGYTINFISNPVLALGTEALAAAGTSSEPSSGASGSTAVGATVTGFAPAGAAASNLPAWNLGIGVGLNATLNTGLTLGMDMNNIAATAMVKTGTKTLDLKLSAIKAALFGGKADAGAAHAKVHARAGIPPHPPITG